MDSPKTRFLKTEAAKRWADVAKSPTLIAALDTCLLEMGYDTAAKDTETAAQSHWRMVGARQLAHLLTTICDVSPPPKPRTTQNLEP